MLMMDLVIERSLISARWDSSLQGFRERQLQATESIEAWDLTGIWGMPSGFPLPVASHAVR